jgi:hypothetical protein
VNSVHSNVDQLLIKAMVLTPAAGISLEGRDVLWAYTASSSPLSHLKPTSICCITHSLQGLTATPEQLGANAAATATEFETFEDLLALSTTGMCAGVTAVG